MDPDSDAKQLPGLSIPSSSVDKEFIEYSTLLKPDFREFLNDITGPWHGRWKIGRGLRSLMHILKTPSPA